MKASTETLPRMAVAILLLTLPAVGQPRFTFATNNGTITITGYPGPNGAVTIPAIITGLPVTSIGAHAFSYSYAGSVTIPNSVTNIESGAFSRCSWLTDIVAQSNTPAYSTVDGVLFNKDQTVLVQYPADKFGGQFTIPNTVTTIGDEAFYGGNYIWLYPLTNVVIGNSVRNIGNGAFYGCWRLDSVTIPNSVTNIGNQAFAECGLSAITVDALNPAYTSVGGVLFDKNQTALIQYPAGKARSPYTIPSTVANIADKAFAGSRVDSVTIPTSVLGIGNGAFSACEFLANIVIPGSVVSIGNEAFSRCGLTSVTIPSSVTTIGDEGFADCSGLTQITIPDSVTHIGDQPFSGCWRLSSISVDALNPAYSSVSGVLFDKNQTALLQYPAGKAGGQYMIPNSVIGIGNGGFAGCGLTNISIPNSVISIGDRAFYSCHGLTDITIPNSVTNLGGAAFANCSGLTNLTIGNGVRSLVASWMRFEYGVWAVGAFEGCNGLTHLTIPNSVTEIGTRAFSGCWGLTNVSIPTSVISIGDWAFAGCYGLTSVTIPNSVISIGDWAFAGCYGLTDITIPDSVTNLGGAAFANCSGLTNLTIGNGVRSLVASWMGTEDGVWAVGAFADCNGLTHLTIPNSVTEIGTGAFSGCSGLTNVAIPASVICIGNEAFSYCTYLTDLMIPNSVTNIGDSAFADCYSLTGVYFQGNAPGLGGSSVFNDSLTVFYLPGTTGWGTTFGDRPTAPWVLPNPLILNFGSSFGVQSNRFGFLISWATNIPVVIEASTTLVNSTWTPLSTNTLADGASYFSDPEWTNYPSRFYRLRSP